jgi:hypothetical protein
MGTSLSRICALVMWISLVAGCTPFTATWYEKETSTNGGATEHKVYVAIRNDSSQPQNITKLTLNQQLYPSIIAYEEMQSYDASKQNPSNQRPGTPLQPGQFMVYDAGDAKEFHKGCRVPLGITITTNNPRNIMRIYMVEFKGMPVQLPDEWKDCPPISK